MRDLNGLKALLARAGSRAEQPPTYRFHGRKSPKDRQPTPVLAEAPTGSTKDGVATLRLYEPIDSWGGPWGVSAIEFLDALDQLDTEVSEIRLHINSPGGEVWEALAILNGLRQHDAKVVAVVDGIAASCASFIACAADETIMAPNSQLMIHDAWGLCVGNAAEMHGTGDLLDQISDNIASIYASKAGGSTASWRTTMRDEGWYLATEAVAAGLADRVLGGDTEEADAEDAPVDAFDLKGIGMKYAGRDEAPAPAPRGDVEPPAEAPVPDDRRARLAARRRDRFAERAQKRDA